MGATTTPSPRPKTAPTSRVSSGRCRRSADASAPMRRSPGRHGTCRTSTRTRCSSSTTCLISVRDTFAAKLKRHSQLKSHILSIFTLTFLQLSSTKPSSGATSFCRGRRRTRCTLPGTSGSSIAQSVRESYSVALAVLVMASDNTHTHIQLFSPTLYSRHRAPPRCASFGDQFAPVALQLAHPSRARLHDRARFLQHRPGPRDVRAQPQADHRRRAHHVLLGRSSLTLAMVSKT